MPADRQPGMLPSDVSDKAPYVDTAIAERLPSGRSGVSLVPKVAPSRALPEHRRPYLEA